jgi:hypothetical protein
MLLGYPEPRPTEGRDVSFGPVAVRSEGLLADGPVSWIASSPAGPRLAQQVALRSRGGRYRRRCGHRSDEYAVGVGGEESGIVAGSGRGGDNASKNG